MELKEQRMGDRLLLSATGRLDATWADFFKDALLQHIRAGEHQIVLDAAGLTFLSSLGIRALMVVYKKLIAIDGSFHIVHAAGMVKETLQASGLDRWLSDEIISTTRDAAPTEDAAYHYFTLKKNATLQVEKTDAWQAWDPVRIEKATLISYPPATFGFGIGAAGETAENALPYMGEFIAAGGQVAIQPPDEHGRPDCLLAEQQFVPQLHTIQSWTAHGEPAELIRFRSTTGTPFFPLSSVVQAAADTLDSEAFGLIIIGEIEGLTGAQLIRSPSELTNGNAPNFPEIKEWISYCGERVFNRELVLITGIVNRDATGQWSDLRKLNKNSALYGHLHAAVFPFQFLPNGHIDLTEIVQKIFNGPPPKAVMHLVADERPVVGLGESALYNGACWFAPISPCEVSS